MTISSTVRTAGPYAGDDAQTVFPFSFKVFTAADLLVTRVDADTQVQETLTLSSDYTVSLNGDQDASPGGTVTLLSPLAAGRTLGITSSIAILQTLALTNSGGFYPKAIEAALDRIVILLQQIGVVSTKQTLRVPEAAGADALPVASARAGMILGFDAQGRPTVTLPASGSAVDVMLQLASATAGKGSTLVAHNFALNYVAGTIGAALNDLALQVKDTGTAAGNSAAINAMITVMAAGQVLYLPDAMDLDSTVQIALNKAITLRGNPNKRVRFSDTTGVFVSPIRITADGVTLENLWFDGSLLTDAGDPADTGYYLYSTASGTTVRGCRFTDFPVYRVPVVSQKFDASANTSDWFAAEGNCFENTGGGIFTTTSNSRITANTFYESTDTAIAVNGMAALCVGAVLAGNVIFTSSKVGPYLIAIEGAADVTVTGNYVHATYGQALAFIDVAPGTQTAQRLGTVSGNTFRCETTADTDPRCLVQIGGYYFGGTITGNTLRGVPGVGTNASQLLVAMGDHLVSGNTFDTAHTATANAYAAIDYQPALVGGSLTIRGNRADVTRAARFVGSTQTGNFSAGSDLLVSQNTIVNSGALCSIMVDAPANGGGTDPALVECSGNSVLGTAIPTAVSGLAYNTQSATYGREFLTFSGTGSAGKTVRSPASFTGINYYSDSLATAGAGWKHLSCTSSNNSVENLAILGNGNVQNANNSYGALSDLKLKQDISDASSQWDDVKALRLRKYRFKSDPGGLLQLGVIAQEAELVSPGLIEETADIEVVDGEARPTGETTKSVKYSVLYLKALGALQEAMGRIEALEQQVADLRGAA